ncbi:hypothetical protein GYO_2319 [Bacillus spizizenii TU-B-10]|uniref:Uncharacterized protein n=1 Tax=Bacillus spizizenii (strain DSM 15029 / JCM 12233 / NBRC 101239 / NRRL B-23049 / TU-B-10) TaxID=1052585 RepID=G4NQ12_BACS4|nr:hypothetical protein GYO_2319 [Bacillus spizizenii TU-B-10]
MMKEVFSYIQEGFLFIVLRVHSGFRNDKVTCKMKSENEVIL